jgi:hypothetical protein
VPALTAKRLGASYSTALRVLIGLNGLAFCGLLALMWRLGRHLGARWVGPALVTGFLASPLLWYSHAGVGEGLAAFLVGLYTYALVTRSSPWLLGASAVSAGVTKETAVIFLLLIAALVEGTARVRGERGLTRQQALAVALGVVAGVAVNCGFNLFRYGTVANEYYGQNGFGMPFHLVPRYVLALLISPTGGIVFMWPLLVLLLGAIAYWGYRSDQRHIALRPALGVLALVATLLVSVAAWYGPFGGAQWGSRLATPWLPSLAMLAAAFYAPELDAALDRIVCSPATAGAAVAIVALIGLPHLSVTVDSSHYLHPYPGTSGSRNEVAIAPYFPDDACPDQPTTPGSRYYLHCLDHWTWHQGWAIAHAYTAIGRRDAPQFVFLYVAALTAFATVLASGAKRRARASRGGRSPFAAPGP